MFVAILAQKYKIKTNKNLKKPNGVKIHCMLVQETHKYFITLNMIIENFALSECRKFRQRNTKTAEKRCLK